MAPPRFAFGIVSAAVSFVLTQPVVADLVKKYFGAHASLPLYIILTATAFTVIGFCLYLFLQDMYSILCHRGNHKTIRS